MEDRIQDLIQEVYEQKELKQRAELKQLQEQINPHFLYNSLFSIRSKIYREEYESAEELTELLGRYFRYLTRNAQDYVELSQEVDHAYCYARIQASRFAARMEIRLAELPEEMQKLKVPRLIIQPLLENALEYGLGDKEENGLLAVSYEEKDGRFYIHSEDNGSVTEEVLEKMRESLQKGANEKGEVTGIDRHAPAASALLRRKGRSGDKEKCFWRDLCDYLSGRRRKRCTVLLIVDDEIDNVYWLEEMFQYDLKEELEVSHGCFRERGAGTSEQDPF